MQERGRLDSIQVLRALAAMAVVVHHVFRTTIIDPPANSLLLPPPFLVQLGAAGVDVFFVISGFLMTYIAEPYFAGRRSPVDFFVQRLIRIWPPYAVVTLIQCTILARDAVSGMPFDLQPIRLASLLFVPSFSENGLLHPIIAPGWTLNYEMLFYLCFMGVLFLGRRLAFVKLASFLFILFLTGRFSNNRTLHEFLGSKLIFEFLIGAAIGFVRRRGLLELPRSCAWVCITLAPLLLILLDRWKIASNYRLVSYGIPATLLCLGFLAIDSRKQWPRWTILLGDASYSIYLVHILIIYHVTAHSGGLCGVALCSLSTFIISLAAIAAAVLGGLAFYFIVERPLLRFCKSAYQTRVRRLKPEAVSAAQ